MQDAAEANYRPWHASPRDVSRSNQMEIRRFLPPRPPSSSGRHPSRSHLSLQRRIFFFRVSVPYLFNTTMGVVLGATHDQYLG